MHQFLHPLISIIIITKLRRGKKEWVPRHICFLAFFFLAIFVMISSKVLARELAETSNSVKSDNNNEVHVDGSGGYNGVGSDEHVGYKSSGGGGRKCNYANRCKAPCRKVNGCK